MQPADRLVQETGQDQKCEQIPLGMVAGEHHPRADPNRHDDPERADEDHRRMIKRPDPHHDEGCLAKLVAHGIEAPMLLALAHVTFDLPNAGQVIMQERVHRRRGAPLQPVTPVRRERVPKRARPPESAAAPAPRT